MRVCDYKLHPLNICAVTLCLFPSSSSYSTQALPALSFPNAGLSVQFPLLPQVCVATGSHSQPT